MPLVLSDFDSWMSDMSSWFDTFCFGFVALLISAAVIWTAAIAWRKFKETTNKV